MVTRRSYRPPS